VSLLKLLARFVKSTGTPPTGTEACHAIASFSPSTIRPFPRPHLSRLL
jgi:hypothetical protein